jgi:2-desacetyl-2-hydroxyethyl bacteriochlorophyllide A dehydrogenase
MERTSGNGNVSVTIMGPRKVVAEETQIPRPTSSQVLIKTAYSGISAGTEMNVYRGVAPQWSSHQDPSTGLFVRGEAEFKYPLTYGYANVGTVTEVGRDVESVSPGDRVFSYQPHCAWVVAEATEVVELPVLPDARRGVFLANMNTALNGVLDARPAIGDAVVITGLGIIGLLATEFFRRTGVTLLGGVDTLGSRRSLALSCGATHVFAPTDPVAEIIHSLTDGRGADAVLEASGSALALREAIRIVGYGGLVVALSWYGSCVEGLSLSGEFHHNRVRIKSSQVDAINPDLGGLWSTSRRMELAKYFLPELPLERFISHQFAPEQAADAYASLDDLSDDILQCVFVFSEER